MNAYANDSAFIIANRQLLNRHFGPTHPFSNILVNIFVFGGPLMKRADNGSVVEMTAEKAKDKYREFVLAIYNMQDDFYSDNIELVVFAYKLGFELIYDYTYKDLAISLSCGVFIWLYVIFHVKSIFIASFAMLGIFMSIPISLVIYSYIFDIKYFALLHNLVIIIVLSIGADDIFVFNDMWKQAKTINILEKDLGKRMAYVFKKSAKAMFVTSLTTMISFVSTAISSIIPIQTFGIFAAIIIPINYILIIMALPCYYMIYEYHFKHRCLFLKYRFCKKKPKLTRKIDDDIVQLDL